MDDARAMRPVEGVGDLQGVAEDLVDRQRALAQPIGQRLALQMLHHQKAGAVFDADIEQRADVRVVQGCNGASFSIEALTELRYASERMWKDLDRDGAIEPGIPGAVHFAHASRSERRQDLVGAQAHA